MIQFTQKTTKNSMKLIYEFMNDLISNGYIANFMSFNRLCIFQVFYFCFFPDICILWYTITYFSGQYIMWTFKWKENSRKFHILLLEIDQKLFKISKMNFKLFTFLVVLLFSVIAVNSAAVEQTGNELSKLNFHIFSLRCWFQSEIIFLLIDFHFGIGNKIFDDEFLTQTSYLNINSSS